MTVDDKRMKFAQWWIQFIRKTRYIWFVFWLACTAAGGAVALRFVAETSTTITPPSTSKAAAANDVLAAAFPTFAHTSDLALFVQSAGKTPILSPHFEAFTYAVQDLAFGYKGKDFITNFQSYYVLRNSSIPEATALTLLVSPSNLSSIVMVSYNASYSSREGLDFANFLRDKVKDITPKYTKEHAFTPTLTGVSAFIDPITKSVESDMGHMDLIVMPLALAVLAYILKSVRVLIVCGCAIAAAATTSFLIMFGVGSVLDVSSFTPSMMMSVLLALSIDYSLFLLTRYREELLNGHETEAVLERVIWSAGHTIFISGLTLIVCFIGLLFFPLAMIQTIGIGCAASITCALAANLTLTPALLLTFPRFFEKCAEPTSVCGVEICSGRTAVPSKSVSMLQAPLMGSEDDVFEQEEMLKSCWYRFAVFILRFPVNVISIVLICGLVVPFALHAVNFEISDALDLDLPRGRATTQAFLDMSTEFGYGVVTPYRLLIQPPSDVKVFSKGFFQTSQKIIHSLGNSKKVFDTNVTDFSGFMFSPSPLPTGQNITYAEYLVCKFDPTINLACNALQFGIDNFVNKEETATYLMLTLKWDPLALQGREWLANIREELLRLQDETGYKLALAGVAGDSMDAVEDVYKMFPIMVTITISVVFVLVGFAFKSLFIPLRATMTISLALLWIYGFATLTYQYGVMDWTGLAGLKGVGALMWMTPIMSLSIIVGVGLDYDIFLLTRIEEYWNEGFSTREAITRGLWKTGHIITTAGIIMAIAFSGLLFSSTPAINQLSFFLVFSVLFDTFVVRSILVPCIMDVLGELNWWPMKQPTAEIRKSRFLGSEYGRIGGGINSRASIGYDDEEEINQRDL